MYGSGAIWLAFAAYQAWVAGTMYRKSRAFPNFFIAQLSAVIAATALDYLFVATVLRLSLEAVLRASDWASGVAALTGSGIGMGLWFWYLKSSRRSRNIFVH